MIKRYILSIAGCLLASSVLAQEFPKEFVLHPQLPVATITKSDGIGTAHASIAAQIDRAGAEDWCGNWRPEDQTCVSGLISEHPNAYKASANCQTGEMTDPHGQQVKFDGTHSDDDFQGWFAFKDLKSGKRVGTDNASGGLVLANQWMSLCPYGRPYDELPIENVMTESTYNSDSGETVGHNGQSMRLVHGKDAISYGPHPSSASIKPFSIVFRGMVTYYDNPVKGIAYTFKKGCAPAPYWVQGHVNSEGKIELSGKAPLREKNSCKVIGYTEKSKNANLVFRFEHY
ncbi:hypothetical protein [Brucella pseudogrignonensis]|uniref:Uncharacterized protein n=1 Tax=Brucella pseudogrignonensis TaxID=419475 RepID=A0ABU1MG88_9HYPH|nr:hypothetical protein [Brucella pseudogrignonensis]MDR6434616.1 hypothetical protein [Brucella pseudogrignonensis]